jgi:hypothetical protein
MKREEVKMEDYMKASIERESKEILVKKEGDGPKWDGDNFKEAKKDLEDRRRKEDKKEDKKSNSLLQSHYSGGNHSVAAFLIQFLHTSLVLFSQLLFLRGDRPKYSHFRCLSSSSYFISSLSLTCMFLVHSSLSLSSSYPSSSLVVHHCLPFFSLSITPTFSFGTSSVAPFASSFTRPITTHSVFASLSPSFSFSLLGLVTLL